MRLLVLAALAAHQEAHVLDAAPSGILSAPIRPNGTGHAIEGGRDELANEQALGIDRAGHPRAALGHRLEPGSAVIRLVSHE